MGLQDGGYHPTWLIARARREERPPLQALGGAQSLLHRMDILEHGTGSLGYWGLDAQATQTLSETFAAR